MCELEIAKEGYIYGYKDGIKGRKCDMDNTGGWNILDAEMFQRGYLMGYKDSRNGKSLVDNIEIRIGKNEIL